VVVVPLCLPFGERLGEILREKSVATGRGMTSYSRISGLFGSVIVTAFFWSIGNIIIWDAFMNQGVLATLMPSAEKFFLVGSALFLPYAFNQLKSLVHPSIIDGAADSIAQPIARSRAPEVVEPRKVQFAPLRARP
jgi:hypothetical protein